ncbi:DNA-binding protein [Streptomyces mashuensis]|uniref:DNA-binding protein n=1 Tax=Streptomyces mashuensis TaxID=33904 RepID=A0A919B637_9ACTN|nr:OB-fold nucleic acid binding domain-containing protein [Streptomyces mashuensis]GHF58857.1 DNA-binding protein [Streptomyces mashuensis]
MQADPAPGSLTAPLTLSFPFTRSLGPVLGTFLTGLRERVVLGIRTPAGRVLVPPTEYDPATGAGLGETGAFVEVAPTGTVTTWAWNPAPRPGQPLAHPFAWVLVRLDGADTALLHALDAPGPHAVRTGQRVRIRWAAERTGAITDIACFIPDPAPAAPPRPAAPHPGTFPDPVTTLTAPARLDYTHTPGRAQSRHLTALARHELTGERCPACAKVLVPPRGACPTCGVATTDVVPVGPRGTVTTFCIVNIKAKDLAIDVPYVYAHILLDGADLPLHGRIDGIPHDQVRMGLRVEAVWTPGTRHPAHYRPTGEPDAPYTAYEEHL